MLKALLFKDLLDVYVVAGLLLIVVVVFVASRIGVLPKKNIPMALAALAAVFGYHLFKRAQGRALDARIKEVEDRIKRRDKELADLEQSRQVARQELDATRAALDQQLAASQKQRLLLDAANTAERERLDALDLPSTIDEYRKLHAQPVPGGH